MRHVLLAFSLALVPPLCCCSCRSTPSHGLQGEVVVPRKSVLVGELLAIFPGIVWHGLGHRYAGDIKKAEEIELLEAYSLISGGAGYGLVVLGQKNDDALAMQIPGYALGGLGALGFIGTWIYDIIYTPDAVARHNARLGGGDD